MEIDKHDITFFHFYRGVSVAMLASLMIPLAYLFFYLPVPNMNFVYPAVIIAAILIGYGMQLLFARITGHKNMALKNIYTYEDENVGFHSYQAIFPVIMAVVIAVFVLNFTSAYLREYSIQNPAEYYDEFSAIPFTVALVTFVSMFLGIVIWFFPPHYLARPRVFFPCLGVFGVLFALGHYVVSDPQEMWLICGSGFFCGAIILMNQTYIQKTFRGSVVSIITPKARLFNLRLVVLLIVMIVVLFFLLSVIFTGLGILIKMLFFFILYATLEETVFTGEEYYESSEQAMAFQAAVFGRRNEEAAQNQLFFAIFVSLIVIAFSIFMLRKKINFKQIFAKLEAWFALIAAFLSLAYDFNIKVPQRGRFVNYRDEETKLQDAKISEYNKAKPADGYKDFRTQLSKLKTYDEKLGYAYKTLIAVYQKMHIKIKGSDTPREAEGKIRHSVETQEINEITQVLEQVKYAEIDLSSQNKEKAEEIINKISAIIKKYMY
jgi:hypothetical protein